MSEKIRTQIKGEFTTKLAEVNKAILARDAGLIETKLQELTNIEGRYQVAMENEVFNSLNTVHDAIVKYKFDTLAHKSEKTDGVLTAVKESSKTVFIDLKKFCEYRGLPTVWWYELQALNFRLTLRTAESIGVSGSAMEKIRNSYMMDQFARDISLGKDPTSNSQCVKHMQAVLDALSEGEGKVNNHDLAYILGGYSKRDNRNELCLVCAKHSTLLLLMTDVAHRLVMKKSYGVTHKADPSYVPGSEEKKPSEKKPSGKKKSSVKKSSAKKADAVSEPVAAVSASTDGGVSETVADSKETTVA